MFDRLRKLKVLSPIQGRLSNPLLRNLDYSLSYAYCFDMPGHDIEKCWYLKRVVQDLINTNQILVQAPKGPNINQNPLPTHAEANILELIYDRKESLRGYKPIVKIQAIEEKSVNIAESLKAMSLSQEGMREDKAQESTKKPLITI